MIKEKAWEHSRRITDAGIPKLRDAEEQTWSDIKYFEDYQDTLTSMLWQSNVPGSGAMEHNMVSMIQALENRGFIVEGGMDLVQLGFEYLKNKDYINLHKITTKLFHQLNTAVKDETSTYWNYKMYNNYSDYEEEITFPEAKAYDTLGENFKNKIKAGWVSQMIGAAMGTMLEGYTTVNIKKAFGNVTSYLREPNTYNDDITFELAFLSAFSQKGESVTSNDIALEWVGLIPFGWSAELIALRNIQYGILPPMSGTFNNPFNEWIGAQMRGAVCGMVAPGNPKLAAELAWKDGCVSHANNGILGEIFNACLASLAFVIEDVRILVTETIKLIPKKSEYYTVVDFALTQCKKNSNWEEAWKACEIKYTKYHWIHSYQNAAAEVIALWFGEGDFSKTINIASMIGQDVDCTAAQIMTVLGIINGYDSIPEGFLHEAFENLITYMRGFRTITLDELIHMTVEAVNKK